MKVFEEFRQNWNEHLENTREQDLSGEFVYSLLRAWRWFTLGVTAAMGFRVVQVFELDAFTGIPLGWAMLLFGIYLLFIIGFLLLMSVFDMAGKFASGLWEVDD